MDSMGKIARDLRAWARNSGLTVPNEYADRIDALMKEPIAWVEVIDTNQGPYYFHGIELLPAGKHHLFAAPPAPAVSNAEFCPHCNPCRNGERIAKAEQLNEEYDSVLRGLASYVDAGGYNSAGLIAPEVADDKIRWGIDHLTDVAKHIAAQSALTVNSPYKRFYEAVMTCAGDTWQCERCGNDEPWWTETNADYATHDIREEIAKLENEAPEPKEQT